MSKPILYDNLAAFYPARARLVLIEKGIEYESRSVDLFNGESLSPSFLSLNPNGSVPVLVDGDLKLTESLDIVHHLDKKGTRLGNPDEQKLQEWTDLIAKWNGNVHFAATLKEGAAKSIIELLTEFRVNYAAQRMKEHPEMAQVYAEKIKKLQHQLTKEEIDANDQILREVLTRSDSQLATSQFIVGDTYTIADSLMTVLLYRLQTTDTLKQSLQDKLNVSAYYNRMKERASFNAAFKATVSQRNPIISVLPAILKSYFYKFTGCAP